MGEAGLPLIGFAFGLPIMGFDLELALIGARPIGLPALPGLTPPRGCMDALRPPALIALAITVS